MRSTDSTVPQKRKWTRENWIALAVVGVIVIGFLAFLGYQFSLKPIRKMSKSEAIAAFEQYYQDVQTILAAHGITEEFREDEEGNYSSDYSYRICKCVPLSDGGELSVAFDWGVGQVATVCISVDSARFENRAESWVEPAEYPFAYEIAAHFGSPKYSEKDLQELVEKAHKSCRAQVAKDSEEHVAQSYDLKPGLFELGFVSYGNRFDETTVINQDTNSIYKEDQGYTGGMTLYTQIFL